jgi:predicted peroxiredoxin
MFRLYDSYTLTDKRKLRELKERRQKFYDELVADAKKMGVIMSSP